MAEASWRTIPGHFTHVEPGAFIVMPDHVHGILILHDAAVMDDGADAFASAREGTI